MPEVAARVAVGIGEAGEGEPDVLNAGAPCPRSCTLASMGNASAQKADSRHWVFWDGECTLCARAARWSEAHDVQGRLNLVPYQQAPSPP